jgi:nitrite reductase (NADH) large subunit
LGVTVTGIEPDEHQLTLAGGGTVGYDRLLLATGGRSWIPPVEGTDKSGVFALRTLEDAMSIAGRGREAQQAVVVGCGLLGLEAGRALQALGLGVSMIEFMPRLLPRQLDDEGAAVLQRIMEGMGLRIFLNASAETILGSDGVDGVRLKDGREIDAQLVLFATGMRSDTDLARLAGLDVDRGIVVDEHMRSSAQDIYAAGDVAAFHGRIHGIVPAAIAQARVAAANMAGTDSAAYSGTTPSTTLKVSGIDLTSLGTILPEEGREEEYQELRDEDPDRGVYRKLVLRGGSIVGAIMLGDKASVRPVTRLIEHGVDVSEHAGRLLEPDFDLQALLN